MHNQRFVLLVLSRLTVLGLVFLLGCGKSPSANHRVDDGPASQIPKTAKVFKPDVSDPDLPSSKLPSSDIADRTAARVRVLEDVHDFGHMNAYLTASHSFTIENVGQSPLKLDAAETTCSCTVGDVPREPIPPGQSAQIRVQWKTKPTEKRFRETITLKTNDPTRPELQFTIAGNVGREVDADPIEFGDIAPDSPREHTSLITSTVLEHFELTNVTCTVPGLVWELTPATPEQLRRAGARSGWQLRARLPADLPLGDLQGSLRFRLDSATAAVAGADGATGSGTLDEVQYEVPVAGKVLRRIAVYGPKIDWTGTITIGAVGQGKGYSANYVVKVRDAQKDLALLSKHIQPEWMQVEFEPFAMKDSSPGLYRLKLHIPADAPISDFTTGRSAKIQLKFDHPRADSLELNVVFSVVSAGKPTSK